MQSFHTYILFSHSRNKFYIGSTNNLQRRLSEHNSGQNLSTKFGIPWNLIFSEEFLSKAEAIRLEKKIKKRGAKRFLDDTENSG
jgi:putative endonuclease